MTKTIILQEDGMLSTEPMPVTEIANTMMAALTGAVQQIRQVYQDEPDAEKIDNELFDGMNFLMSRALSNMFPDKELHPDLTEEAIMRAENEILAERVQTLPKQSDEHIIKLQEHVAKHIDKE